MALLGLHVPTFGPLHPIIGKLANTGLSGFTSTRIPFANTDGSLTDVAGFTYSTGIVTIPTGITITGFNVAGFVKNSAAGLLSGGNTISVADITDIATTYLKLDCSNDPLTGVLHCDDKVEFTDTTEYIDQEEW